MSRTSFLWLDLTRQCQLHCAHCYNDSGPAGDNGTMTRADWLAVLGQGAAAGVEHIQLIGGEPTMHPDALAIAERGLELGLGVEVFSNLVHITGSWWGLFQRAGVTVATSYYSDDADEHNRLTRRPSHRHTRANIAKAVRLGVPIRVGIISVGPAQRVEEARAELARLGVKQIGLDHVRPYGRGAQKSAQAPSAAGLCGKCGAGRAAIGPDGTVSPCVMSSWMEVGNVRRSPLSAILDSGTMAEASRAIHGVASSREAGCYPRQPPCFPANEPCVPQGDWPPPCGPTDDECRPGTPSTECTPRR